MSRGMNDDRLELTTMAPDPERAARVLARCRARLERRTPPIAKVERAAVVGVSVVYLAAVFSFVASVFSERLG